MKHALIIEDDPKAANAYKQKLVGQGFDVQITASGRKGLEAVEAIHPDVVILDLILPEMSGLDVLRAIRASEKSRSVPVVVLSNADAKDIVQQARQEGATKVLSKSGCSPQEMAGIASELTAPRAAPSNGKSADDFTVAKTGDAAFENELRNECLQSGPAWLQAIQSSFQLFSKDLSDSAVLYTLCRRVHSVGGNTGLAGLRTIAALANSFEALINEAGEKRDRVKSSVLRTMAQAIDLMGQLFQKPIPASQDVLPKTEGLVVDDQEIALRAMVRSLEKVKVEPVAVTDPNAALAQAMAKSFDLVVSDIEMPGMSGTEFCAKLRALPQYKKTPILFVTNAADYDHRMQACVSGGTDLIAKPFLFNELSLKALTLLIQARIAKT